MIQPGTIELTRMFMGPKSRASARVSPAMAALALRYAGIPPWPTSHEVEPKLMMEPPPAAVMSGATACAAKKWWRRFTAKRSSQYSGVTRSIVWRSSCAALLTSTRIGPSRALASAMADWSAGMSRRSHGRNVGAG